MWAENTAARHAGSLFGGTIASGRDAMGKATRTVWTFIKFVLATLVGAAGIEICHQYGWYPDRDLAAFMMKAPNHLTLHLAYLTIAMVIGLALVFAEHWLAPMLKMHSAKRSKRASEPVAAISYKNRELFRNARQFVIAATAKDGTETDFRAALEGSPIYLALRPLLSAQFRKIMRNERYMIVQSDGSRLPGLAHCFLDEIDRIEKDGAAVPSSASNLEEIAPDWRIDELFCYLNQNVLDRSQADRAPWETVGNQIRDQLALGRLMSWGRACHADGKLFGEISPLQEIKPIYWHSANFTYDFFDSTAKNKPHTYAFPGRGEISYTDIWVSQIEAKKLWTS